MLDKYFEELKNEAGEIETKNTVSEELSKLPAEDLAKLAGVFMPEDNCPQCGRGMVKTGSILKCMCGMRKVAAEECPGGKIKSKGKGRGKGVGKGEGPVGVPIKEKLAKKDMPSFTEQDRPEKVKEIYRALKRDHPDMPAEMKARIAARQGKPGKQEQGPPYKGPIKPWKEKKSGVVLGPEHLPLLAGTVGGMMSGAAEGGPAGGYAGLPAGALGAGIGGITGAAAGQSLGALISRALKRPGLGLPAGLLGYGAGAVGGGALGGMLAGKGVKAIKEAVKEKTAATPEELREALEEARERVDPEFMKRQYGIGGGILGGLGGGALGTGLGAGIGRLAGRTGLGAAIGAGLGLAGGAVGGRALGRRVGGEEAEEERTIQNLQMARGYGIGKQEGIRSGALMGLRKGALIGAALYHRALTGNAPQGSQVPSTPTLRKEGAAAGSGIKSLLKGVATSPAAVGAGLVGLGGAGAGAIGAPEGQTARGAAIGGLTGAAVGGLGGLAAQTFGREAAGGLQRLEEVAENAAVKARNMGLEEGFEAGKNSVFEWAKSKGVDLSQLLGG